MRHGNRNTGATLDNSTERGLAAGLRMLAHRARTEAEVRNRLARRFTPEVVAQTTAQLKERRFLDDAEFARGWRESRERRRPRGEALLRRELLQRGVAPDVIEEALEGFDAASNAYRAGCRLARRISAATGQDFRRRLWAHLQRKGFEQGVVRKTVERLWQELPELQHGYVDADCEGKERIDAEEWSKQHGNGVGNNDRCPGSP